MANSSNTASSQQVEQQNKIHINPRFLQVISFVDIISPFPETQDKLFCTSVKNQISAIFDNIFAIF